MKYLSVRNTGIEVSTIGLGCEHIGEDFDQTYSVIREAIDGGINFMDVFMAGPEIRDNIGKCLEGVRENVCIQGHFGAIMEQGQPTQSRDAELVRTYFEDFMTRMRTDYVDVGYLHFIDRPEDYRMVVDGGVLAYAQRLKQEGVVRAIGLSTHYTHIAQQAVRDGIIDCLMFPVNPAFDFMPKDQNIFDIFSKKAHRTDAWLGMESSRQVLYSECLDKGIPIIAMKSLGGGMMLYENMSPFGVGMTVHQCVNYALHNPAVITAMVGCRNSQEVKDLLTYFEKSNDEIDYANVLSRANIQTIQGKCTYCNHCLPCPVNIDIATVIKFKDIAKGHGSSENLYVAEHYRALEKTAKDCVACGACVNKCPFGVDVVAEMHTARSVFMENE